MIINYRYLAYAQGLPLLIVFMTMAVDSERPEGCEADDRMFPNMGVYHCFLGDKKTNIRPDYFETANFLYFQGKTQYVLKFHLEIGPIFKAKTSLVFKDLLEYLPPDISIHHPGCKLCLAWNVHQTCPRTIPNSEKLDGRRRKKRKEGNSSTKKFNL